MQEVEGTLPGGIQKSTHSTVPETSLQGSLDNTRQCGLGMPLPGTFSLYFLSSLPPSLSLDLFRTGIAIKDNLTNVIIIIIIIKSTLLCFSSNKY